MNTPRNPILLGQVETIDLLLPEVRAMLQRQGIYLASDSARPGFTVPLVVNADGLWSLQLDANLDPERFNTTVRIAGPFYAPGEVIPEGVRATDHIDADNGFRTYPWTYQNQPGNLGASALGECARLAKPGGDSIDHGLSLLRELHSRGFGIVRVAKLASSAEVAP